MCIAGWSSAVICFFLQNSAQIVNHIYDADDFNFKHLKNILLGPKKDMSARRLTSICHKKVAYLFSN